VLDPTLVAGHSLFPVYLKLSTQMLSAAFFGLSATDIPV
jgi:hypothetical protein